MPLYPHTNAFEPTRQAALERLQAFVPQAGLHYARDRNIDSGPTVRNAVSRLSPYLRHRLLSEIEVLSAVRAAHEPAACEKFVQEVFWRTYFKGYLAHQPGLWTRYRDETDALWNSMSDDNNLSHRYQQAVNGQTGIAAFDSWSRELTQHHYLHNHARMWFASIWIFTLQLPWQLGADFFMQYLLDGDPASNTLSWRWVAGLHTRGKHYLARSDNIARFTDGRYPHTPNLNESAEALQEAPWPEASQPPAPLFSVCVEGEVTSPEPALLLHEDDLQLLPVTIEQRPVAVVNMVTGRSSGPCATAVQQFVQGACETTAAQLGTIVIDSDAQQATVDWIMATGCQSVLTPYAPVGPTQRWLAALAARLTKIDVELTMVQRRYDATVWPHCTKGFFKLKQQIPQLLEQLL